MRLKTNLLLLLFMCVGVCLPSSIGSEIVKRKVATDQQEDPSLIPIPDHYLNTDDDQDRDLDEAFEDYDDEDYQDYNYEDKTAKSTGSNDSATGINNNINIFGSSSSVGPPFNLNDTGMPVFLKEPEDTYLVKNRPAILHCRVAYALSVYFQCNSAVLQPNKMENHVEPETGVRYVEAAIKITRDQVKVFYGDYHCACVAISSKDSKVSRHASIKMTYLKKNFVTDPYSTRILKGKQVEMRCLPPKGQPKPSIYWLKNGKKVNEKMDKNFLISGSGHLIIVNARLSDTGNYSCVAENVAGTRLSQVATLNVFVDGEWGPWSEWSSCSGRCNSAKQKRVRTCSSPTAGGSHCEGPPVQKRECSLPCLNTDPADSGWSTWSPWSTCNPECSQHRSRICKSAEKQRYCQGGRDLENRNCTDEFCQSSKKLVMYGQVPQSLDKQQQDTPTHTVNSPTTVTSNTNLALYIVFSVAIVVFLVVIVVIVRLLRRKSVSPNGYTLTSTDYGYGSSEDGKKTSSSIGYSPDITHTLNNQINPGLGIIMPGSIASGGVNGALLNQGGGTVTPTATVCYEYSYPDSNSNHSKSGFLRPASEHHYEQPMVVFPQNNNNINNNNRSPADSIGKPSRSESSTTTSSSNHQGSSNMRVPSSTSPMSIDTNQLFPITSTPLPPTPSSTSVDPKFTTWATVSSSGARISVPDCNVFLTIPPGAISQGHTVDLFLSVAHHVSHPHLLGKETMLSPVVICGPRDAASKLKKPFIVSLPHSASLRHGNWSVSLLQNEDINNDSSDWSKVVTLGQETLNTPVYAQLDLNVCHVMTDQLTSYALVGESAKSGPATKSIRLAAFAQDGLPGADLTVRIYCLPDTDDALSFVSESEKRYNGRLLDQPMSVLLQDNGDSLCLQLEQLGSGWTYQKGADYLEVPFYHIWNSANPNLHCSFTLRSSRGSGGNNSFNAKLNFKLSVSQRLLNKCFMQVNCDLSQRRGFDLTLMQQHERSGGSGGGGPFECFTAKFRLNPQILLHLSMLLDPPNQEGNDWRLLAERLNVHRYVTFFATRPSPTEAILHLWEARNREVLAVSNLINILRGMGRFDAANVLESDSCLR